ncbi:unnamed protein product [Caenorhabditis angaria]|uniref:Uncharacterized protein n=1 Tax=Caenorhabditis angaria TaxID=860376 RepID=A0A9P1N3K2_9PELO|nr:unnamed protein product [Caenorhabditis angaria]
MATLPGKTAAITATHIKNKKRKKSVVSRKKPKPWKMNMEQEFKILSIGGKPEADFQMKDLNEPVICFRKAQIHCPGPEAIYAANLNLLEYVGATLDWIPPLNTSAYAEIRNLDYRTTGLQTNMCLNPLMIMRGWGLLANVATGKTLIELSDYIHDHFQQEKGEIKNEDSVEKDKETAAREHEAAEIDLINQLLIQFHVDIEEDVDGCIRLFTDIQEHLLPDDRILHNASVYYGGKSVRSAVQQLCFATDPDGFYSCYRINEEVAKSTNRAVRYVVPEKSAPNWRSSMVVVSASDCTFHWKTTGPVESVDIRFEGGMTPAWKAKCSYWVSPDKSIYKLQGEASDYFLYLIRNDANPLTSNLMSLCLSSDTWIKTDGTLVVPHCVISTPISLFEVTKSDKTINRIYCSEKSELYRLHSNQFENKGNFITLWDHYHKSIFKIITEEEDRNHDRKQAFDPNYAHVCTDDLPEGLTPAIPRRERANESFFTYYEDHLDKNPRIMENVDANLQYLREDGRMVMFNTSFHFIMTRHCVSNEMILCAGRFTNTPLVNHGLNEAEKK